MGKRSSLNYRDILNPSNILSKMVRDYANGAFDTERVFWRVYVSEIDLVGGQLENDPPNPPGSIKGRIITDAIEGHKKEENFSIFWPMFPFSLSPIKTGEHCYVVFEDPSTKVRGLWLTRIPERSDLDNKNYIAGIESYKVNRESVTEAEVQGASGNIATKLPPENYPREKAVPHKPSLGDHIVEGSHNNLVALTHTEGDAEASGVAALVTGKPEEGSVLTQSKAVVAAYSNVAVDDEHEISPGDKAGEAPAAVVVADEVRVVGNKGLKIVVGNNSVRVTEDKIVIEGGTIELGENAAEGVVLGQKLVNFLTKMLAPGNLVAGTGNAALPVAPSPALAPDVASLQQSILSKKVKSK